MKGRPSAYQPAFAGQAKRLCLLGATDAHLAEFFEVSETTINNWKAAHPDFLESLKAGKEQADANVANSLYRRALGYQHRAVKIFMTKDGGILEAPYTERYAPDTAAAIFWLKNRRPDLWRDKQDVTHSGGITTADLTAQVATLTPEQRKAALQQLLATAAARE